MGTNQVRTKPLIDAIKLKTFFGLFRWDLGAGNGDERTTSPFQPLRYWGRARVCALGSEGGELCLLRAKPD